MEKFSSFMFQNCRRKMYKTSVKEWKFFTYREICLEKEKIIFTCTEEKRKINLKANCWAMRKRILNDCVWGPWCGGRRQKRWLRRNSRCKCWNYCVGHIRGEKERERRLKENLGVWWEIIGGEKKRKWFLGGRKKKLWNIQARTEQENFKNRWKI